MRLRQIIFLSLVLKGYSNPLPLDSVSPVEESLSKCVAEIANEYFNKDLATALFIPYREYESRSYISTNDSHVDFLVQSLHQRIDHPLVMLDYHNSPQSLHQKVKLGSYIIILSGEVSWYLHIAYEVFFKIDKVAGQMSHSGRLLIATTSYPKGEKNYIISSLLRQTWLVLQISEAIVLIPKIGSTNPDVIEVYKWFPEKQYDPCLLFLNRFVLFYIWIMKRDEFFKGKKLYQNDLITDMRGCILNISFNELVPLVILVDDMYVAGPVIDQIRIIGHFLNLRFNFYKADRSSDRNMKLPVAVNNGENKDVLTYDDCIVTYPYFKQNLKWVVPAGAPVPRWKSLIKIFNPLLWLCVVTTFLIGSITSWLLLKENQQSLTYISVLLDTLLTYVVAGISDRYKGTVASTFFVLWLFYCLIINTAYQSALISFLADPGQDQPIKTIEELHKSGLHLMCRLPISTVETANTSECINPRLCLITIAKNRDSALLEDEVYLSSFTNYFLDSETNRHLLHTIEENARTFYFTINVHSHGCLIFKRMEQLIHRIWGAGLMIKCFDDISRMLRRRYYEVLNDDPYVITLSHLQGVFYFMTTGLFVSIIVFLIEISYYHV
ncbi:Ionotropic receptor 480 [Blattella germanica]|nr:Ionotropic receptor 480 [Blattella germanica]